MKFKKHQDGLSARRKIIQCLTILSFCTLVLSSCNEKTNEQTKSEEHVSSLSADSLNKPKVNIQVNRQYDSEGNVIGFDSTYASNYSNVQGDRRKMDSLMHGFDRFFNHDFSSTFKNEFQGLFFNDSLRYPDFFHDDFFMKRYELNDMYFRDMMHRMDSIKNRFYQENSTRDQSKDL